jgi:hypothetical protein
LHENYACIERMIENDGHDMPIFGRMIKAGTLFEKDMLGLRRDPAQALLSVQNRPPQEPALVAILS